jgi:hypothetical protein
VTANNSPRLGLMLPNNADPFDPDDFVETFTVLDGAPGVTPIANLAALPTGLTTAQHMSQYIQADNGAIWYWYKPSSGTPGAWMRSNSVGMLSQRSNGGLVQSTSTAAPGAVVLGTSVPLTAPGVRALRVDIDIDQINSSGSSGLYAVLLYQGSTLVKTFDRGGLPVSIPGDFNASYIYPAPAAGASLSFGVSICTGGLLAQNPTGTVSASGTTLTVSEI